MTVEQRGRGYSEPAAGSSNLTPGVMHRGSVAYEMAG